ncbi:hypothetical protein KUV92_13235 [Priestia flexa]|nr:hypothetical protein [Priestia flexa]
MFKTKFVNGRNFTSLEKLTRELQEV